MDIEKLKGAVIDAAKAREMGWRTFVELTDKNPNPDKRQSPEQAAVLRDIDNATRVLNDSVSALIAAESQISA